MGYEQYIELEHFNHLSIYLSIKQRPKHPTTFRPHHPFFSSIYKTAN